MNSQIYMLAHKPVTYGLWNNELYSTIECGADFHNYEQFTKYRDNEFVEDKADSVFAGQLSKWNGVVAEQSGALWLWLRMAMAMAKDGYGYDYVGLCQYRRRLKTSDEEIESIFKDGFDAILPRPLMFLNYSVEQQYSLCHNIEDLNRMKEVIKDLYPELYSDWDKYITNGHILFYSAGLILSKEDFNKLYDFHYNVFNEYLKRYGFNSPQKVEDYVKQNMENGLYSNEARKELKYQTQILGFIAERLNTLYFKHYFKKPCLMDYTLMEDNIS